MPFSNVWLGIFFATMILLGIDTQFGNLEVVANFVNDSKIKFLGKQLKGKRTYLYVCLILAIIGLPMTTEGGYWIFWVYDNYVFRIPVATANC